MGNSHLFRGLDLKSLNPETLKALDNRITDAIEHRELMNRKPFTKHKDLGDYYFIRDFLEEYYPDFPSGGYETAEKGEVALAIWKVNRDLDYNRLYFLSSLIVRGLH